MPSARFPKEQPASWLRSPGAEAAASFGREFLKQNTEKMTSTETTKRAVQKAEVTRLHNLLSKQAKTVLNHNETMVLKRLLQKMDAENYNLTPSFQIP